MDLKQFIVESGKTQSDVALGIDRAQSVVSRIANGKQRPEPDTAIALVVFSKGTITMDELYSVPRKFWAKH